MTATRLQFGSRQILDAFEAAIRPLDETASGESLNDNLLELVIDELLSEDDPARLFELEPWVILVDVCDAQAYEMAMLIDDCHQAGHHWHAIYDRLSLLRDAKLVDA